MSATNTEKEERAARYNWDGVDAEDFEIIEGDGEDIKFEDSEAAVQSEGADGLLEHIVEGYHAGRRLAGAKDENPLIERKISLLNGALIIYIENEQGSLRSGPWGEMIMKNPYGYIASTVGVDGDAVDCFLGEEHETASTVYVIHQGAPDPEDKVMLGFKSAKAAAEAYEANYTEVPEYTVDKISLRDLPAKLVKFSGRRLK